MLVVLLSLLIGVLAFGAWRWYAQTLRHEELQTLVSARQPLRPNPVPCPDGAGALRLLILGQSNAGNHGNESGAVSDQADRWLTVFDRGGCHRATDPLPGATGQGWSMWPDLRRAMAQQEEAREPVVSLFAVEATRISEWTHRDSPLREGFVRHLQHLRSAGFEPDAVLWQQGEADAAQGTSEGGYLEGLRALRDLLHQNGVAAPLLLAQSTRCRLPEGHTAGAVINAQAALIASVRDVRRGPDTDSLGAEFRWRNCHFNASGLREAAQRWALALESLQPVHQAR